MYRLGSTDINNVYYGSITGYGEINGTPYWYTGTAKNKETGETKQITTVPYHHEKLEKKYRYNVSTKRYVYFWVPTSTPKVYVHTSNEAMVIELQDSKSSSSKFKFARWKIGDVISEVEKVGWLNVILNQPTGTGMDGTGPVLDAEPTDPVGIQIDPQTMTNAVGVIGIGITVVAGVFMALAMSDKKKKKKMKRKVHVRGNIVS